MQEKCTSNKMILSRYIQKMFSGWGLSLKGFLYNNKGEWLLLIQIILLLVLLFPGYPLVELQITVYTISIFIGLAVLLIGILLSLKAVLNLGPSFTPLPEPKENSEIILDGSYKYFRHPLYRALIIISIGMSIYKLSLLHLVVTMLLSILLKKKAQKEEINLVKKFPEYKNYQLNTPAISSRVKYLDWRK